MLWGKNKRGQKIGVLNWTRWTVDNDGHLIATLQQAAARVANEGGRSLIVIVDVCESADAHPRKDRD